MTKQTEARQGAPAIDIYEALEHVAELIDPAGPDWAVVAQIVALHIHDALPEGKLPDREKHLALIDRVVPRSSRDWGSLHDSAGEVAFEAVEFGARLGYALAKTWPDSLEGLDTWPAAAWRYGEVGQWITWKRQQAAKTAAYHAECEAKEAKRAAERAARQVEQPEGDSHA